MTKKIDWKFKYEQLHSIYCEEHSILKTVLYKWKETIYRFENYLYESILFAIGFLLAGFLLGLTVGVIL